MILIGYRRQTQRCGSLMWPCDSCRAQVPHVLVGTRTYITAFLVPIVPLPRSRKLVCTQCGRQVRPPREQVGAVEQAASAGASRPAAVQAAAAGSSPAAPGGAAVPPYAAVNGSNWDPPSAGPTSWVPPQAGPAQAWAPPGQRMAPGSGSWQPPNAAMPGIPPPQPGFVPPARHGAGHAGEARPPADRPTRGGVFDGGVFELPPGCSDRPGDAAGAGSPSGPGDAPAPPPAG